MKDKILRSLKTTLFKGARSLFQMMTGTQQSVIPIDQYRFITNWNTIATTINKKRKSNDKLFPLLSWEGNCAGLTYTHQFYVKQGWKNEFYGVLNIVNGTISRSKIIEMLQKKPLHLTHNERLFVKDLLTIINMTNTIQEKQSTKRWQNDPWKFEDNIGFKHSYSRPAIVKSTNDVLEKLQTLKVNQGYEIRFLKHSISVFRENHNKWIVYDSDSMERTEHTNENEASVEIIKSINNMFYFYSIKYNYNSTLIDFKPLSGLIRNFVSRFFPSFIKTPEPIYAVFHLLSDEENLKDTSAALIEQLNNKEANNKHAEAIACEFLMCSDIEKFRELMKKVKLDVNKPWNYYGVDGIQIHPISTVKQPELIDLLIKDYGLKINRVNAYINNYVLHQAIEDGNLEMVKKLLEVGIDANKTNKKGETPLFFAVKMGNAELVKLLLPYNDPNIPPKNGKHPLLYALKKNDLAIADILYEKLDKKALYWPKPLTKDENARIHRFFRTKLLKASAEEAGQRLETAFTSTSAPLSL